MKYLFSKNVFKRTLVGSMVGVAMMAGSSVFAASTVPGSVCMPSQNPVTGEGDGSLIKYFSGVALGAGASNLVDCPIPNGSSNGTIVVFRINVTDNSNDDIECQGIGRAQNGNIVLATNAVTSSGSGPQTLTVSQGLPSGVSSTDLSYSVTCTLPGPTAQFISSINRIKID